jgi:hypothetical protein
MRDEVPLVIRSQDLSLRHLVGDLRLMPIFTHALPSSQHHPHPTSINYVQFQSSQAAQAVLRHLAADGYLQRNTDLGLVTPGQYELVFTLEKI